MKPQLIIFDYNRTLFDPDRTRLFDDTLPILQQLAKLSIPMLLISRLESKRLRSKELAEISEFFDALYFCKQKTPGFIKGVVQSHTLDPSQCLSINDHLPEVELIASCGITSYWLDRTVQNNGKKPGRIQSLTELTDIVC